MILHSCVSTKKSDSQSYRAVDAEGAEDEITIDGDNADTSHASTGFAFAFAWTSVKAVHAFCSGFDEENTVAAHEGAGEGDGDHATSGVVTAVDDGDDDATAVARAATTVDVDGDEDTRRSRPPPQGRRIVTIDGKPAADEYAKWCRRAYDGAHAPQPTLPANLSLRGGSATPSDGADAGASSDGAEKVTVLAESSFTPLGIVVPAGSGAAGDGGAPQRQLRVLHPKCLDWGARTLEVMSDVGLGDRITLLHGEPDALASKISHVARGLAASSSIPVEQTVRRRHRHRHRRGRCEAIVMVSERSWWWSSPTSS